MNELKSRILWKSDIKPNNFLIHSWDIEQLNNVESAMEPYLTDVRYAEQMQDLFGLILLDGQAEAVLKNVTTHLDSVCSHC